MFDMYDKMPEGTCIVCDKPGYERVAIKKKGGWTIEGEDTRYGKTGFASTDNRSGWAILEEFPSTRVIQQEEYEDARKKTHDSIAKKQKSREQEHANARNSIKNARSTENAERFHDKLCKLATKKDEKYSEMLTSAYDHGGRETFRSIAEGCEAGNVIDGGYITAECVGGKNFSVYQAGHPIGEYTADRLYSVFKKHGSGYVEDLGITLWYPHTWDKKR